MSHYTSIHIRCGKGGEILKAKLQRRAERLSRVSGVKVTLSQCVLAILARAVKKEKI